MKTFKKIMSAFLCLMFFAILSITIMLLTNVAFNKDSSSDYFNRYNTFQFIEVTEDEVNG